MKAFGSLFEGKAVMTMNARSDLSQLSAFWVFPSGPIDTQLSAHRPDVGFMFNKGFCTEIEAKRAVQEWLAQHNIVTTFTYQSLDDVKNTKNSGVFVYFHARGVQY